MGCRMWVSGVAQWGCQMLHGRKVGAAGALRGWALISPRARPHPLGLCFQACKMGASQLCSQGKKGSATLGPAETAATQGHPGHGPKDEASRSAPEYRQGRGPGAGVCGPQAGASLQCTGEESEAGGHGWIRLRVTGPLRVPLQCQVVTFACGSRTLFLSRKKRLFCSASVLTSFLLPSRGESQRPWGGDSGRRGRRSCGAPQVMAKGGATAGQSDGWTRQRRDRALVSILR